MLKINVRKVMEARGIFTPYKFMVKNGFTPTTATKISNGDVEYLRLEYIERLCTLLNCLPNDLFDWTPNEKKEDSNKNSFLFVIISTIVELAILAGVYFNQYYRFRSYREYRERIERDPNFQKWMLYEQILDIIYREDTRMNEKLQSNKAIIEICKVNGIIILPKDITEFLKVVSGLGIIKVSGSAKYINKQRDLSLEILRKHYGVE
jgi:DNA-binding Xre family transcriptional regulator